MNEGKSVFHFLEPTLHRLSTVLDSHSFKFNVTPRASRWLCRPIAERCRQEPSDALASPPTCWLLGYLSTACRSGIP